jgi:hypothetical protein
MTRLADLIIADACPTNRFLEEMTKAIPWTLFDEQLTQHIRHKTGRDESHLPREADLHDR